MASSTPEQQVCLGHLEAWPYPPPLPPCLKEAASNLDVPLPIDSHVIPAASYNGKRELVLAFSTGAYGYSSVPDDVVPGLLRAPEPEPRRRGQLAPCGLLARHGGNLRGGRGGNTPQPARLHSSPHAHSPWGEKRGKVYRSVMLQRNDFQLRI